MQAMTQDLRTDHDIIISALTTALAAYARLPASQQPTALMARLRTLLAAEPAEAVANAFVYSEISLVSEDLSRPLVDYFHRNGFFSDETSAA